MLTFHSPCASPLVTSDEIWSDALPRTSLLMMPSGTVADPAAAGNEQIRLLVAFGFPPDSCNTTFASAGCCVRDVHASSNGFVLLMTTGVVSLGTAGVVTSMRAGTG